jgi:hypothetical protein
MTVGGKARLARAVGGGVALLILVVLVAELVLWAGFREGPEPRVRVEYKQDVTGLPQTVLFERNDLGMRGARWGGGGDGAGGKVVRVLCVGGSEVDQAGLGTGATWSALLEGRVNAALGGEGVRVEVAAYGRPGARIYEVLGWVRRELPELRPDVVISLFGGAEMVSDEAVGEIYPFEVLRWQVIEAEPGIRHELARWSQIYRSLRAIRQNRRQFALMGQENPEFAGMAERRQLYWDVPEGDGEVLGAREGRRALMKESMGYLLDLVDGVGARAVVCGQPSLAHGGMDYLRSGDMLQPTMSLLEPGAMGGEAVARWGEELGAMWRPVEVGSVGGGEKRVRIQPSEFRSELGRFNLVQREVAEGRGHLYVNLDEQVAPGRENFYDEFGLTEAGSERVAEVLAGVLVELVRER